MFNKKKNLGKNKEWWNRRTLQSLWAESWDNKRDTCLTLVHRQLRSWRDIKRQFNTYRDWHKSNYHKYTLVFYKDRFYSRLEMNNNKWRSHIKVRKRRLRLVKRKLLKTSMPLIWVNNQRISITNIRVRMSIMAINKKKMMMDSITKIKKIINMDQMSNLRDSIMVLIKVFDFYVYFYPNLVNLID